MVMPLTRSSQVGEALSVAGLSGSDTAAADQHPLPPEGGVFFDGPLAAVHMTARCINQLRRFGHELVHGDYPQKFKDEFKQRYPYTTADGVKLTARVLNPEFLDNEEHAIVYSYSLLVPAGHGAELPTVADIAAHGEENGRAVIAITTDGLAGPMNSEQLGSLTNFWSMPSRRFEVLRQLLPPGKRLIVTGSSLGGMMSHALAATWEKEAEASDHLLEVTHNIAVASAGHDRYTRAEFIKLCKQFGVQEVVAGIEYVGSATSPRKAAQRLFEILGTVPRHPAQLAAVAFIGLGIMAGPLQGVEFRIPHSTKVIDVTFDRDGVTHPHRRAGKWRASEHPDTTHVTQFGPHLALLTLGRAITIDELNKIPGLAPSFPNNNARNTY